MATEPTNLFWDSCVFGAFLYDEKDLDSIKLFIAEAKAAKYIIYTSSIIFAEIADSKIKQPGIGSMNDLVGATIPVDPSINIMTLAGRLKDIQ